MRASATVITCLHYKKEILLFETPTNQVQEKLHIELREYLGAIDAKRLIYRNNYWQPA